MWWAWPHLRRFWAGVGTLAAGLTVTYVYNLWSRQAVPDLRSAFGVLHDYWVWTGSALLALMAVSVVAERAHRRHQARAPQPLRVAKRSWRERFQRPAPTAEWSTPSASTMVGRTAELAKLNDWFAKVKTGSRRVMFVSGEPGIGKTTLTRAFLGSIGTDRGIRIGRGQCVEQYGAGEPYMPILEALTRLCREPGGDKLVEILHRLAPACLAEMPSLVSAEDRARLQSLAQGTTQQRMLREMAEALEVIAADSPLVLFIEDLHWSDPSTLDLIATVARRSESARLMILGTYRPVEMLAGEHPLRVMKEELELHHQAIELRLSSLSEADVAAYVSHRFADNKESIAPAVYARSEGNPLFMVNVVDYLVEQGSSRDADKIEAPRNIRQMIERNLQRLSAEEQGILEAASVAGAEFSAAAVAAALERPVNEIEARCTSLARREQFVTVQGTTAWPDGTRAASYRFMHALYREALYERAPVASLDGLHRRIAYRMEAAHDGQASEIAAELSDHFRRANEADKAIRYLQLAGERAVERRAYREAQRYYRDALSLLAGLAASGERDTRELALQLALGGVLVMTQGWSGKETRTVYVRARHLVERTGSPELLDITYGLWLNAVTSGRLREASRFAEQLLDLTRGFGRHETLVRAHYAQGFTCYALGYLAEARVHFQQAIEHYREDDFRGIHDDSGVNTRIYAGINEWLMGWPDRALRHADEARSIARRLNKPFATAHADAIGALTYALRGDYASAHRAAHQAETLGKESGFPTLYAVGKIIDAWTSAKMGEVGGAADSIQSGIAEAQATRTYTGSALSLFFLGETQAIGGAIDDAVVTLNRALRVIPEELCYRPLILTLRGELRFRKEPDLFRLAELDFRDTIELSKRMGAKSPELRATTSLARLLRDTGRADEARTMLAEVYGWFTEGFDTKDLKEAKELLDELA
jgi:predicted ATPase